MVFFNITGPAATQITGWHSILFILYTTARLHCVCLLRFTMLYFVACCSFSVIFSLRATMLINLNLKQCLVASEAYDTWTWHETSRWTVMLLCMQTSPPTFVLLAVRLSTVGPAAEIDGTSGGMDGNCCCCWRSSSLASHCANNSLTSYSYYNELCQLTVTQILSSTQQAHMKTTWCVLTL